MYIAICDDSAIIRQEMEQILWRYQTQTNREVTYHCFASGEELQAKIEEVGGVDLILLDIEMNQVSGVELGRWLRDEKKDHLTEIVYISGKEGYEMQLFEVHPLHFLRKPVQYEKLAKVLDIAYERLLSGNKKFCYKIGNDICYAVIKDILYFESNGKKIKMMTRQGMVEFADTLARIETELADYSFLQPHRAYLVNYYAIEKIRGCNIRLHGIETSIPISRLRRADFSRKIMNIEKEL
ncbi:DNA-binding response regulator [Clostridiales bacterium COT073_COT-073]|nr:DNA-binding response regulator [Clostridiales bacterium COT073_COT-073]